MNRRIRTAVALSMLAFPVALSAQQAATVGELIDKGGRKLARDELVKLLSGATVRGISVVNQRVNFEATYKSDGNVSAIGILDGVGSGTQFWGTWAASEQDEICTVLRTATSPPNQLCTPYYLLGSTYYQALKDEKSSPVRERAIRR